MLLTLSSWSSFVSDAAPQKIGSYEVKPISQSIGRVSMLLWGPSGAGKTTLASTFPGPILWILYDPDGQASISNAPDIYVMDMTGEPPSHVTKWNDVDPMRISKFIAENGIKTVVFDSLTTFQDLCLRYGVENASMTKQHRSATLEDPGFGGYGRKKRWLMSCVANLMQITKRLDVNMCFISHEDSPAKDNDGNVLYITMILGSDLPQTLAIQFSEIWYLRDDSKGNKLISVQAHGLYRPMKTRMFQLPKENGKPVKWFAWDYDPFAREGETVAEWIDMWREGGYTRVMLPTGG